MGGQTFGKWEAPRSRPTKFGVTSSLSVKREDATTTTKRLVTTNGRKPWQKAHIVTWIMLQVNHGLKVAIPR